MKNAGDETPVTVALCRNNTKDRLALALAMVIKAASIGELKNNSELWSAIRHANL